MADHPTITCTLPATLAAILAALILAWWMTWTPDLQLSLHVPGMDGRPATLGASQDVTIGAHFAAFNAPPPPDTLTGSWPRFRGPNVDNIRPAGPPLDSSWSESEPPVLWSISVGEGHAAPAVHKGRVYLLDYDEATGSDMLRCLSLATGQDLWRRWYEVKVPRNHGMSRTVPAVTDRFVVTIGPKCHVMCVDSQNGDLLWGIDMVKEYGTDVPMWYTGQCPLIDDRIAVLAPAGPDVLLAGIDCETGETRWTTPNPGGFTMSHSSVIPATIAGKRMYLYCATGGTVGVSAEPADRGTILWKTTAWNRTVIAPVPVVLPDGRVFLTAGYGGGGMMITVTKTNRGEFEVAVLQEYKAADGLASEQQTPILFEDHLFAVLPKDAGPLRNQLVCVNPDDTTRIVWASGKTHRFGLGPLLVADGKMFVLSDDGTLTMLQASTEKYIQLAQTKILDGHDAWGPLAIADGRLLLRDNQTLACVDLREDKDRKHTE